MLSEKGNGVKQYIQHRQYFLYLILGLLLFWTYCTSAPDTVTPDPTNNLSPVADAGNDTTVQVNETISLHGTGTDPDGNIVEYAWRFGSNVDWIVTSSSDTSIKALPPPRSENFHFRAMDNNKEYAYDSVKVTIKGSKPQANAGDDKQVSLDEKIKLNGTGSDDDGEVIEYAWKFGATVDWVITSSGDTSVIALPPARVETFHFRVKDNDDTYGYDSLQITITEVTPVPPVANAGNDTTVKINETINLHGTGTDIDGYIVEYAWQFGGGNWIVTSDGDTSITAPSTEQVLVCILRVKDNDNETGFDSVNISIQDTGRIPWIPIEPLEYYKGMVKIKGNGFGFQMGSDSGRAHEQPVHTVGFTHDFWMDTVEVTQGKYTTIMSATYTGYSNPAWSQQYGVGANYPVYYINWFDVVLYCNALSNQDGIDTVYSYSSITGVPGNDCELEGISVDFTKVGYRLPTEAEWEYSCRGGTTTECYWGGGNSDEYAWANTNSNGSTQPVGTKLPNVYGLYDMSGNLWEWCNDCYGDYTSGLQIDPTGASTNDERIIHGGAWYYAPGELRSANRNYVPPDTEGREVGFRVILPVK